MEDSFVGSSPVFLYGSSGGGGEEGKGLVRSIEGRRRKEVFLKERKTVNIIDGNNFYLIVIRS